MKAKKYQKKNLLTKINKYLLRQLFDNLQEKQVLEIIKYNKEIKKKLSIDLELYKNYKKIEIEIIPKENIYEQFINICKEDEPYYHIYFDDKKKDMKIKSIRKNSKVKKIKIIIDDKIESLYQLFYKCNSVQIINFTKFNIKNITNMSYMFAECKNLEELNISKLYSNNVVDMSYMFYYCESLKKLNVSYLNTQKVKNMECMFSGLSSLIELDLNNFNTCNVKNMEFMFFECSSLKKLDVTNFNTKKVTTMEHMFQECSSLNDLDITNFNIKKDTNIYDMFYGCPLELQKKVRKQNNKIINIAFI